jgi:uncharacterized protein (DUF2164 family)
MASKNGIRIERAKREEMTKAIRDHFLKERGEEMGNLASDMILDFVIEELGPIFYNMGVMDSYYMLNDKVADVQQLLK